MLHSEPDCANLVLRDGRAIDPGRFFCSNLVEADAIGGRSRARLAAAVRAAVDRRRPAAVFVIGGCVAGLVADDVARLAESLRLPRGVRVVALDGGAFSGHGQAEVIDRFTGILAEAAPRRARRVARSIGLVGYPPDGGEAAAILRRAGLGIRAWPQLDSPREEWNALPAAAVIAVGDGRLFGRLAGIVAARHGVPVLELGARPVLAGQLDRSLGGAAAFRGALGAAGHEAEGCAVLEDRSARELESACAGLREGVPGREGRPFDVRIAPDLWLPAAATDGIARVELGFASNRRRAVAPSPFLGYSGVLSLAQRLLDAAGGVH
ncbi:MAG: hypothetical protein HY907_22635 [Deltaproteobacteria bacterium]|nr:hypothetical protein [Deltaproteobacteria bacterium]